MRLFDRVVELSVGETRITGLDIAFEIEKDLEPEPNASEITIFNLSLTNRAALSKYQRVPVILKAGYRDSLGVIFQGDMLRCSHIKEDASWITVLSCGDGANSIQSKRTNKSYAKGTSVKTVVGDLSKHLGLATGNADSQLNQLNSKLARSLSVSSSPMAAISRLLRHENLSVSVQNSALQILKKGTALPKEAICLSADSGLLASPEVGTRGEITLRALLMPEFAPGRLVHIDSATYQGLVVIHTVRFSGASFGDRWEAQMEGWIK